MDADQAAKVEAYQKLPGPCSHGPATTPPVDGIQAVGRRWAPHPLPVDRQFKGQGGGVVSKGSQAVGKLPGRAPARVSSATTCGGIWFFSASTAWWVLRYFYQSATCRV